MSGGSSFSGDYAKPQAAASLFDSAVQEGEKAVQPAEPKRNVFISFHVEDEAQVNLLRSQAANQDFDMEFRDYSVKAPFDEAWRRRCAERIAQTSMTIVMIGPGTANREAVNWEIEESYRQGKKVIGVRIYRDANHQVPEAMARHGAPIINWSRDEIAAQLRR